MVVMSLDGCLTRHQNEGTGFASGADRLHFRDALAQCDCTLMGGGSYRAARDQIQATLDAERLRMVLTRSPEAYAAEGMPGRLEFRTGAASTAIGELARRRFRRCAVVGGPRTLTDCIRQGVLGELWLTVEPMAFGEGRRLVEGAVDFGFGLESVERLGAEAVLLKYRVTESASGPAGRAR